MRSSKPTREYLWQICTKKGKVLTLVKTFRISVTPILWTQRGMIPRPSDYESAALTD